MTCEEKINEILKTYTKISLLSNKNGCKVIRLRHKALGKDIVLHILNEDNEAYKFLKTVNSPNLPIIFDYIKTDDAVLVLEEFIDGVTVLEVMETGTYAERGLKSVIIGLCNALDLLHKNGYVHRDVKPENIMVDKRGRVVLIDYNISRQIVLKDSDTKMLGTAGYAAPEQLGIKSSDSKTDIYAVGVLINVMLTGHHPTVEIVKGAFGKIVRKCTAINPDERYKNVRAIVRAIKFIT